MALHIHFLFGTATYIVSLGKQQIEFQEITVQAQVLRFVMRLKNVNKIYLSSPLAGWIMKMQKMHACRNFVLRVALCISVIQQLRFCSPKPQLAFLMNSILFFWFCSRRSATEIRSAARFDAQERTEISDSKSIRKGVFNAVPEEPMEVHVSARLPSRLKNTN